APQVASGHVLLADVSRRSHRHAGVPGHASMHPALDPSRLEPWVRLVADRLLRRRLDGRVVTVQIAATFEKLLFRLTLARGRSVADRLNVQLDRPVLDR